MHKPVPIQFVIDNLDDLAAPAQLHLIPLQSRLLTNLGKSLLFRRHPLLQKAADTAPACIVAPDVLASLTVLDVLVGPAGAGKTTTLAALADAWRASRGGEVIALAPSASAAHVLGAALGVRAETTAKWLHESVGPGALARTQALTTPGFSGGNPLGIRERVGRLARPLEFTLNTPSHHRVHHASQGGYLDRNFGGILIVWDRLFGSFAAETQRPVYGLTKNIDTYNPLRVAFHEYAAIGRDLRTVRTLKDRYTVLFRSPGKAYFAVKRAQAAAQSSLAAAEPA